MNSLVLENLTQSIEGGGTQPDQNSKIDERRSEQLAKENGFESQASGSSGDGEVVTFTDAIRNAVSQVNQYQVEANQAIKEMVAGRNKNVHETLLAIERADMSLKLMVQVRNKVLDAYREIMRMQV